MSLRSNRPYGRVATGSKQVIFNEIDMNIKTIETKLATLETVFTRAEVSFLFKEIEAARKTAATWQGKYTKLNNSSSQKVDGSVEVSKIVSLLKEDDGFRRLVANLSTKTVETDDGAPW